MTRTHLVNLDPFTPRANFSYFIGIYLAVNAIRDAYLVVDGPDCVFLKGQHIQGRHDLCSGLFDPAGDHRIVFTGSKGRESAPEAGKRTADLVEEVGRLETSKLIFVSSLTPCAFPGERISGHGVMPEAAGKKVVHVQARSLDSDWLDGYGRALASMALRLEADRGVQRDRRHIGIVGYLMDRNEADHEGNISELQRILRGISLDPVCIWLSGGKARDLERIREAGTIISFPYAREAARIIAEKTGAAVIETDLPLGLESTVRWIRDVSAAAGGGADVESFIRSELSAVIPRLEWIVPAHFLNKKFYICSDPYLSSSLGRMLRELGGNISGCIVTAMEKHRRNLAAGHAKENATIAFEPREARLRIERERIAAGGVDLVITSSEFLEFLSDLAPCVELGFPSCYYHALAESPFLGFRGCLYLAQRIANATAGR